MGPNWMPHCFTAGCSAHCGGGGQSPPTIFHYEPTIFKSQPSRRSFDLPGPLRFLIVNLIIFAAGLSLGWGIPHVCANNNRYYWDGILFFAHLHQVCNIFLLGSSRRALLVDVSLMLLNISTHSGRFYPHKSWSRSRDVSFSYFFRFTLSYWGLQTHTSPHMLPPDYTHLLLLAQLGNLET